MQGPPWAAEVSHHESSRLFLDSRPPGGGDRGEIQSRARGEKGPLSAGLSHTHTRRQWTLSFLCPCSQDSEANL